MTTTRVLIGGLAAAGTLGLMSGTAGAAAPAPSVELTCGTTTELVTVNGNGEFTPARSSQSTTVYVPISFGEFTGTVLDLDGNVVEQFTEPGSSLKGKKGTGVKDTIDCTYSASEVSDGSDPNFPAGYTFVGTGEVTGFTTPRR